MDYNRYNKMIGKLFERVPWSDYDYKDKDTSLFFLNVYMLNRLQSMFRWEGLPETVPQRSLELYLMINGNCCFTKVKEDYYVLTGGPGGEPDPYYMPTIYTVANPALDYSANLRIDEDCVIIPNDSLWIGLMPMLSRYNKGIVENEISLNLATINLRRTYLITAPDDRTKLAADLFLKQMEDGDPGAISDNEFLGGIQTQPFVSTGQGALTQLLECEQYLKASLFNELGLNANFNMKRESIVAGEADLNQDALLPLIDNMLLCRQQACEKINELYGLEISVSLASSWEDNQEEIDAIQDQLTEDPEQDPEEPEQDPEEPEEDSEEGGENDETD